MNDKTKFSKEYLEKQDLIAEIRNKLAQEHNWEQQERHWVEQQKYYRSIGFWRNIIIVFVACIAATATITAAIVKGAS